MAEANSSMCGRRGGGPTGEKFFVDMKWCILGNICTVKYIYIQGCGNHYFKFLVQVSKGEVCTWPWFNSLVVYKGFAM